MPILNPEIPTVEVWRKGELLMLEKRRLLEIQNRKGRDLMGNGVRAMVPVVI
jgi:hypothetical protein